MLIAVLRWWRKRQREIDKQILWPACRDGAATLQEARGAFYVHCLLDDAWRLDLTQDQIIQECERLT